MTVSTTTPEAPAAGASDATSTNWSSLVTVSLGYLLVSWGMAPVSSILPTISNDLQIDVTAAGWIMNAYFLLLVGAILLTGRLGDLVGHRRGFPARLVGFRGHRRVFTAGIVVFGVAGVAAGFAMRYKALIVARAVQGLGSAMVFGTSLAL